MVLKLSKTEFVRTFLKYKKSERLNGRISKELRSWINKVFPGKTEAKVIDEAISNYLFSNGLRLIADEGKKCFRIEAKRPYVKNKCRKCWFYQNWN